MTTGLVWHELYMWHDTGTYAGIVKPDPAAWVQPALHFENAETKRRIKNLLDATGYIDRLHQVAPRSAEESELLLVHTRDYLDSLQAWNAAGGDVAFATPMGAGGYDIAKLSAGGCLELLDHIVSGKVKNGYALCRPPGHHALPNEAMGFCFLLNGAITAKVAQKKGLHKIAIVDWDVHHGNGAEAVFYDDPSVLTISLHQDNCFPPESGALDDRGEGDGEGANINIPLPPGSGEGAYLYAFENVVIPALDDFEPDLILVASGFDAMGQDPLGRNMLMASSYAKMTQQLMDAADRHCGGKLLMTHEGGYNPTLTPFAALAVLETLRQEKSGVEDPFAPFIAGMGGQALQDHQKAVIDRAALLARAKT